MLTVVGPCSSLALSLSWQALRSSVVSPIDGEQFLASKHECIRRPTNRWPTDGILKGLSLFTRYQLKILDYNRMVWLQHVHTPHCCDGTSQ